MRIAFLGLGQMGRAIARILARTGYELSVWNRSTEAAEALAKTGASVAATPAACVAGASVIFTMLFGDEALHDVLLQEQTLSAIERGATHVSLGTISVALAETLEREHAARGQRLLGCPVFGRPGIAEQGKLWLAVGGEAALVNELAPLLSTFSRGMTVVGSRPSQAHAVKLAGNFLITAMIASLSEGISVAEKQGIDPALYLETVNSALFQSPFYEAYGRVMLDPPDSVAATMKLGRKDTHLFREAAGAAGVSTPLASLFEAQFSRAVERGAGEEDWAAGYLAQTRLEANKTGSDT